jgi:7-carboxy-7-deazaguanine synthase
MSKKFPVLEMFCSIQGEGKYTGTPSIFIRLAGCNLRCVFGNTRCDTPYSSFELEKPKWDTVESLFEDFMTLYKQNNGVSHVVITGGEPLLHKDQVKEFITLIQKEHNFIITIETNGTLPAIMPWEDDDYVNYVDLWSVSPKLSTSVDHNCKFLTESQRDNHDKIRINIDNLRSYFNSMLEARSDERYGFNIPDVQLKFVYSGEESIKEIKTILSELCKKMYWVGGSLDKYVMLMPEGTTNEHLNNIQQECAEVCIKEGWKFCDRLHIRIWGDKRGV